MKETKIKMFLYVISATDLPEKDIGSKSDPFIIVNIGNEEIDVFTVLCSLKRIGYRTKASLSSMSSWSKI
jgi:hypothetical protein